MDIALGTCQQHAEAILKREAGCGPLVGLIPIKQLEDARGWWRLMELACIQDPHDEYVSARMCKEYLANLDDRIAAAKNAV